MRTHPFLLLSYILTLSVLSSALAFATEEETSLILDEIVALDEIVVETSVKETSPLREEPVSATSIPMLTLERQGIKSAKELSGHVPNLLIPDYGSSMTSSIYVRGLGARIDQPVIGLIIDNIPYLNKNNYDFDFFDIQRIDILRGAQSTLYGRNTMGGLIRIATLSPLLYEGVRANVDYGTANTLKAKASFYKKSSDKFGCSAAATLKHTDGLFRNTYRHENCDPSNSFNLRLRQTWRPSQRLSLDNILQGGVLSEGGYAYQRLDTENGTRLAVGYNDPCSYERKTFSDGVTVQYTQGRFSLASTTSYQFLDDNMNMDQDFTPQSMFTLQQKQHEHIGTEDIVMHLCSRSERWRGKFGLWGFVRHNRLSAPVTFKREGIETLILANANKGIATAFPDESMDILESQFPIHSDFTLPTYGTALYHQSDWSIGKWGFTLGLRLDYEKAKMHYNSNAELNYRFSLLMNNYKPFSTQFVGDEQMDFVELLPKIAIKYNLSRNANLYASVTKGYKVGGFNTQIFSDILQSKLMNGMMDDMGIHLNTMSAPTYNSAEATSYKPEYSWNYEVGTHLSLIDKRLSIDAAAFYIDCKDQQLTVFPKGKSTGRMMTNAGRSRSIGAELSVDYRWEALSLTAAYGYTNAQFSDYDDGNQNYAGKFVPYSPLHTASSGVQYDFRIHRRIVDIVSVAADWKGIGKIYWDERNEYAQPFYSLIGASVSAKKKNVELRLWGKNLTNTKYDTFYFKSIGNHFFNAGKPLQLGVSLSGEF